MHKHMITILMVVLSVFSSAGTGQALAGHWILGSISIRDNAGRNQYGERLSVFLVSEMYPRNQPSAKSGLHQQLPPRFLQALSAKTDANRLSHRPDRDLGNR